MSWPIGVIVIVVLVLGLFLQIVATVGILRLPDFFTRIHTVGKADTAGIMLILLAVGIGEGLNLTTIKLVFLIAFYFLANPAAAHALANAALRRGLKPWRRPSEVESGSPEGAP